MNNLINNRLRMALQWNVNRSVASRFAIKYFNALRIDACKNNVITILYLTCLYELFHNECSIADRVFR